MYPIFTFVMSYRHSLRCHLKSTVLVLKEHNIWQMHYKTIKWIMIFIYLFFSLMFIIPYRHLRNSIFDGIILTIKEYNIWRMYYSTIEWNNFFIYVFPIDWLPFNSDAYNIKPHDELNRLRRSTISRWCITEQYSKWNSFIHMFYIHFYLFIQTLTTLYLGYNAIGFEGAQFLANALQNNRVREDFYLFFILVLIILYRHSLNWYLNSVRSVIKEHNI